MSSGLILASASPRRQQILKGLGFEFTVEEANIEESYPDRMDIHDVPEYLAELKAKHVAAKSDGNQIICGADTVVILDNRIVGKPYDRNGAIEMLRTLSGKKHTVITGVCIIFYGGMIKFHEATHVYFKQLEDDEIVRYVDHFEPYDKAGSYAIQEWIGMIGIERIEGDYFNVVGLPASKVYQALIPLLAKA